MTLFKTYLTLPFLLLIPPPSNPLSAFDCRDASSSFSSINLLDTAPCDDPETDFDPPLTASAQILEISDKYSIEGFACKIIRTEEVTRCGFTSITYGSETPIYNQRIIISPEECQLAASTGRIKLIDRTFAIKVNAPSYFRYYSHGSKSSDGTCTTATFVTNGIHYTKSYQLTSLEVSIKRIRGMANSLTNTITFTNGLRGNLHKASLTDFSEGVMVWNPTIPKPLELTSTVMKGEGRLYVKSKQHDLTDSIFVIEKQDSSQVAGLIVKEKASTINAANCFNTQINKIVICLLSVPGYWNSDEIPSKFLPEASKDNTHFESMLSYVTISSTLSLMERFATLHTQLCLLHQDLIRNKLNEISGTNNPHALVSVFGHGHQIASAGGAAYVVKCQEVEVIQTPYHNCTLELPVKVNDTLMFMDVITRNLQLLPSIVTCSKQMPPRYPLPDGSWICAYPDLQECIPPMKLPVTDSTIQFNTSVLEALGSSIYSDEQKAATVQFLNQFSARSAIEYGLSAGAISDNPDGVTDTELIIPIGRINIDDLQRELNLHFFGGMFSFLGHAFDDFIGALLLLSIIRVILTMITRMIILINERGCGWWIFACVWGTAFDIARVPVHFVKTAFKTIHTPSTPPTAPKDPTEIVYSQYVPNPERYQHFPHAQFYMPMDTWRSYRSHDITRFGGIPPGPSGPQFREEFAKTYSDDQPPSYPASAIIKSPTASATATPAAQTLPSNPRRNNYSRRRATSRSTHHLYPTVKEMKEQEDEEETYLAPSDSISQCSQNNTHGRPTTNRRPATPGIRGNAAEEPKDDDEDPNDHENEEK